MKRTALLMLVSTSAILHATAVPVTSAEYLPDWTDDSLPTQKVLSQVNAAGPTESLIQVSAETENFVQVWDGMEESDTDDEAPVLALAQTEDGSEALEVCEDVHCKLNMAYNQVSSTVLGAYTSAKEFVQTEAKILTGTVGEAETETDSTSGEVNATGDSEAPTR